MDEAGVSGDRPFVGALRSGRSGVDGPCGGTQALTDIELQVSDGNGVATYEFDTLHSITSMTAGESVDLEFDNAPFTPTEAKLNYTLDGTTHGSSTVTIQ